MRIHTKTVWDMNTLAILEDECFEWNGTVEQCKAADDAKAQLNSNNQITKDQLAQQKAIRDQIMKSTEQYTTGAGQGYDPAQFAGMISQFLNQNSANFNQAGQSVMSSLAARGAGTGQLPVGGDYTRGLEDLQAARATGQSQGVLGANISNLQQALNNRFNALNVQSGQSAQVGQNIGTFSNASSNSLNSYINASQNGFMGQFTKALGAGLGSGLAAGASGGIATGAAAAGKAIGSSFGTSAGGYGPGDIGFCWIAEALYGVNNVRTHATRKYLMGAFGNTFIGKIFVSLYKRFGKRLAQNSAFVALVKPLFDRFARKGMALLPKADINDFESVWYQR